MKNKKLSYENIRLWLDDNLDIENRTVWVNSKEDKEVEDRVNYSMAKGTIKKLLLLDNIAHSSITLYLNNQGGCVANGMAIFDCIKSIASPVNIIACGQIYSMAILILQSAKKRFAYQNTKFMFHDGEAVFGGSCDSIELQNALYKQENKKHYQIMFEKMKHIKKNNSLPPTIIKILEKYDRPLKGKFELKDIEILHKEDIHLTAQEALQLNLIDKIIQYKK